MQKKSYPKLHSIKLKEIDDPVIKHLRDQLVALQDGRYPRMIGYAIVTVHENGDPYISLFCTNYHWNIPCIPYSSMPDAVKNALALAVAFNERD